MLVFAISGNYNFAKTETRSDSDNQRVTRSVGSSCEGRLLFYLHFLSIVISTMLNNLQQFLHRSLKEVYKKPQKIYNNSLKILNNVGVPYMWNYNNTGCLQNTRRVIQTWLGDWKSDKDCVTMVLQVRDHNFTQLRSRKQTYVSSFLLLSLK